MTETGITEIKLRIQNIKMADVDLALGEIRKSVLKNIEILVAYKGEFESSRKKRLRKIDEAQKL